MKNNIISCPTPKELELDCLTNIQEDELNFQAELQQYYNEKMAPVLVKAVKHGAGRFDGEIKYSGYIIPALESKGWLVEWNSEAKAWIISQRTKKDVMRIWAWKKPFRVTWCFLMAINFIDYTQTINSLHTFSAGWIFALLLLIVSFLIVNFPKIDA